MVSLRRFLGGSSTETSVPGSSDIEASKGGMKRSRLLILGGIIVIAVLADIVFLNTLRAGGPRHPSPVLPAIASLHELRSLVKDHPEDPALRLSLGQAYLRIHHYLSASQEFGSALKSRGDEWAALTGRTQANIHL